MTELETVIRDSLASRQAVPTQPDWEDVLRRARVRPTPRLPSRRPRRTALVTAVALLVALLAVPSFGLGGRLKTLIVGSGGPGLTFETTLNRLNGTSVGSFSMRTPRLFVTLGAPGKRVPHPFAPSGKGPIKRVPFGWTLELAGGTGRATATLERRTGRNRLISRLCSPCPKEAKGLLGLSRANVAALVGGQVVVVVATGKGRARGVPRL
jgi:hypothetical protein